jgi:hypothetical protein
VNPADLTNIRCELNNDGQILLNDVVIAKLENGRAGFSRVRRRVGSAFLAHCRWVYAASREAFRSTR